MMMRRLLLIVIAIYFTFGDSFSFQLNKKQTPGFQSSSKRLISLHATKGENAKDLLTKTSEFTASTPYALVEAAVVFTLLSSIDGGFSGDWSTYGLITKDTEALLQSSLVNVGFFHFFCASIAAFVTNSRQQPVLPAILHTLLIGGLGLFRVVLQTDETAVRFPSISIYSIKQFLADLVAGDYDAAAVNADIDQLLKENNCVMFSFTTCPFCIKAKEILINELGANVKVIELDQNTKVGYPIRAELGRRTGRTSVPSVWVKGTFIGGCNDGPAVLENGMITASGRGGIVAFHEEGLLKKMLK